MEKRINKRFWFSCGKIYGFAIGFNINKNFIDIQFGFFYIGLEF
jgi:hypothetical protein